ncbi:origin recognition complex protein 5 [Actinidia rufa]|uniref:Origin recognition complex protein 5 n=1 Tax=Actinidia rufa TaxID=165716 RepID=A0A7J0G7Q7_9ERIC|nr:origin recognition complex protein 5 [Actinidia rufa]
MVYLIIDNLELVREWDKSANLLPFLFKLYAILMIPEVGLVYISNTSPDTYYSDTGYIEPVPVYFPDYTEKDLCQIFPWNQANPKLHSSFLKVVLRPFCRTTRRVDELSAAFSPLFKKYCEPLSDLGISPSEEMKRRLYSHLQSHIMPSLNEVFKIASRPSSEVFLDSRNPATLDASLFNSTGGSDNRKRKRKSSVKSMEHKEAAEQELLMKGPGTFPLESYPVSAMLILSAKEEVVHWIAQLGTNLQYLKI